MLPITKSELDRVRKMIRRGRDFTESEVSAVLRYYDLDEVDDVIDMLWRNGEISGVRGCAENVFCFTGHYYEPHVIFLRLIRWVRVWWHNKRYRSAHSA